MLHGVKVLRMPHRQKNDVAKQLKRRERIMVTPTRTNANHVNLDKKTTVASPTPATTLKPHLISSPFPHLSIP